jgi:hypothetical protein
MKNINNLKQKIRDYLINLKINMKILKKKMNF